jgi:peroxiredoxin
MQPKIACGVAVALSLLATTALAEAPTNPGEALALATAAGLQGRPGPAIKLTTLDGDVVDLEQSYGRKPVYLEMWATWCTGCRAQMPALESRYSRIKDEFTVVAVATGFDETESQVRSFVKQIGLKAPVAVDDGRLAAALGLRVTPTHVVIGRDGRVLHVGNMSDARLEAALTEAAQQRPRDDADGRATIGAPILSRLPQQTVTTVDGEKIELAPVGNREPTALVFFLPWCESYFAKSFPEHASQCREVREEAEALRAKGGVRWIGVASGLWETEADTQRYREKNNVTLPLVEDDSGELFRSFGVRSTPTIVVFAPDGRKVATIGGEGWRSDLEAALQSAPGEGVSR